MPTIGWFEILIIVAVAIIVVGPKDFPLMLKKVGKDNRVPFGPSIAAGTLLTLLTRTPGGGNHIINWYFTNMF